MAATAYLMEWRTEMETELINEIQKKPNLWDIRDNLFTKKGLKRLSYEEISAKLSAKWPGNANLFTPDLLLRKFGNLKTYFRRERKKSIQLNMGNEGNKFVPRWEHFQRLSFLSDSITAEEVRSDLPVSSICETSSTQEINSIEIDGVEVGSQILAVDEGENLNMSSEESSVESNFSSRSVLKTKRKHVPSYNQLSPSTNGYKKLNNINDSVDEIFGHYIALQLKTIKNEPKKELLKIEIQKMIFQAKYSR